MEKDEEEEEEEEEREEPPSLEGREAVRTVLHEFLLIRALPSLRLIAPANRPALTRTRNRLSETHPPPSFEFNLLFRGERCDRRMDGVTLECTLCAYL